MSDKKVLNVPGFWEVLVYCGMVLGEPRPAAEQKLETGPQRRGWDLAHLRMLKKGKVTPMGFPPASNTYFCVLR
jgi:hypothetical protein